MEKKHLISLFIIFIMASSVIGYSLLYTEKEEAITYNNLKFIKIQTLEGESWIARGTNLKLNYNPTILNEITLTNEAKEYISNLKSSNKVYLIIDFNDSLQKLPANRLYNTLIQTKKVVLASDNNEISIEKDIPLIECVSASPPIISFQTLLTTAEKSITLNKNCLSLNAEDEEGYNYLVDKLLMETQTI